MNFFSKESADLDDLACDHVTINGKSFQNYDDAEEHLEYNTMNNSNNSNKSFQNNNDMQDEDDETTDMHENFEINDNKSITSAASSDFRGVSLADAYKELNNITNSEQSLWPNETYKEFMTAVTRYHLSDAAADSMLRILRKHCTDPLPGSTKKGRIYIDNMDIKGLQFKEKDLVIFEGEIYKLRYRPIFDAIKSLVSNTDLSKDFLLDYNEQWEHGHVSMMLYYLVL